jgi:hypothetical protein
MFAASRITCSGGAPPLVKQPKTIDWLIVPIFPPFGFFDSWKHGFTL